MAKCVTSVTNETFKLINFYIYNKFLIYIPVFLIPLIGQVRFTLSQDCHTINWYDFFQASYLLVGLLFSGLIVEIVNFIEKTKSYMDMLHQKEKG